MTNPEDPTPPPPPAIDPVDQAITATVNASPVFRDVDLDDPKLHAFIDDMARDIHPRPVIATRYGFHNLEALFRWLQANPGIVRRIKERQALWASDGSASDRTRALATQALNEALPYVAKPMFDPLAPAGVRLDTAKLFARMAGVDGMPAVGKDGQGPAGAPFVLNISFAGAGRTQTISATVVDPATLEVAAAPA